MKRPDLPEKFSGWQVIDATPQETSDGMILAMTSGTSEIYLKLYTSHFPSLIQVFIDVARHLSMPSKRESSAIRSMQSLSLQR